MTADSLFVNSSVYFLGKLSASSRKEAEDAVRLAGGKTARSLNPNVHFAVIGEEELLRQDWNQWNDILDEQTREAFESGKLKIITETTFWDIIQKKEPQESSNFSVPLYTPVMLAELTNLPVSYIRRLEKQQVIFPHRKVHQLSYFGFDNIAPLKLFRKMLDAGFSFQKSLRRIQQIKPQLFAFPLDVHITGSSVLFQTESGLQDQNGQEHFGFLSGKRTEEKNAEKENTGFEPLAVLETIFNPSPLDSTADASELCEYAWNCESGGQLQDALNLYRAALAAGAASEKANALINFQTAELLYRMGDLTAARERYFAAIEIDENFVEARANLGCVLAELGETQLAEGAFRGALKYHPDYAEVHYHLAELLRKSGNENEAEEHLRIFTELAPDSPLAVQGQVSSAD
ncbi:O-linked GlcNAc transferase [Planctomycetales bacterium]|nr:O-linked GlcNAc transferase [Planctomycetales bacterium]GHT34318.1 O-linked GlcNAc transferase [Planctomycetales bacterium]